MPWLALDTSTSLASIALVAPSTADTTPARLLAEYTWEAGQRHGVELFERITMLLHASGLTPSDLQGVAVACGPGSFNGARVALTAAKTLAFALSAPLVGVSTLDVLGWGAAQYATGPVWALLDAGRDQFYAAEYDTLTPAQRWRPLGGSAGYLLLTAEELVARLSPGTPALLVGEWRATLGAALANALQERGVLARCVSPLSTRRAAWLAELALARAAAGAFDDPMTLEPLYLRRPAITTSAKSSSLPLALRDTPGRT